MNKVKKVITDSPVIYLDLKKTIDDEPVFLTPEGTSTHHVFSAAKFFPEHMLFLPEDYNFDEDLCPVAFDPGIALAYIGFKCTIDPVALKEYIQVFQPQCKHNYGK